jgi:trk system potassium uptake protein TrkH
MSFRRLVLLVSAVVEATGAAMFSASIVGVIYREWDDAWAIALAAAIVVILGDAARRWVGRAGELSTREGFAAVGLSWVAMTFVGTIPFLVTGAVPGFTDAVFETAAGFTTTGASVVPDPAQLSHSILWWRALTQWMGGMGIIVLSIAVLPLLGVGGVQLARAESPGPAPDRLTPRFRETAKRLWYVYVGFTGLEAVLLAFSDMTIFDAITHSFTTMSTGGFGTRAESLAAFNPYAQWVAVMFMIVAGASFALHFRALRAPREYGRSAELRVYMYIAAAGAAFLVIGRWGSGIGDAIREGVFNAVSIITTTGYANADFGAWNSALQIAIVGFMFVGGMAGSTAGGVKTYRLVVLTNAGKADLRRLVHPLGIFRARIGQDPVDDDIVHSVQTFFLFYMLAFMTGTLVMGVIESRLGVGQDLVTSVSAVASALGNIGPGLGGVGPTETYAAVPTEGKWLLSSLMIIGRLEIFPIILLFTRDLWRR